LEAWAGTDLVDRSSYPTRLTPAGETFYPQALEMLRALQSTRTLLRTHEAAGQDMIAFAVPHTLAFTFFPTWVSRLHEGFGGFKSRLIALNVHDAVMHLVEGSCDLLIAYHHASQPIALDAEHYDVLSLGQETLGPYAQPDDHGVPRHVLPGTPEQPLPYLGYASGAYLGQMVEQMLKQSPAAVHLNRVYETDMSEGLKAMALQGHGVAFLPLSAVERELEQGKLVSALPAGLEQLQGTLQIWACRARPTARHHVKPLVQALWDFLVQQHAATHGRQSRP
jgi:DNA-binding transcriptional LysR family regulator